MLLKISQNLQENTWVQSLFFNKIAGLRVTTSGLNILAKIWNQNCLTIVLQTPLFNLNYLQISVKWKWLNSDKKNFDRSIAKFFLLRGQILQ